SKRRRRRVLRRARVGAGKRRLPVLPLRRCPVPPQQRVTGRQGMNRLERRSRRQRGPEGENVVQAARVDLARDCRIDEQRLYLGSKQQAAASNGVEQRAYADSIPGQEQRLRSTVPDTKRPLTVQSLDRRGAVLFKEVKDDLGIGLGAEAMAFRYEFF